jgi:phenylacetate-coenzyme A ligase PaaK-like adenylate-forming protein
MYETKDSSLIHKKIQNKYLSIIYIKKHEAHTCYCYIKKMGQLFVIDSYNKLTTILSLISINKNTDKYLPLINIKKT